MNKPYKEELDRTMKAIEKTPTYYFYNKLSEETGEVAEVASAFMGSQKKVKKLLDKHKCLNDAMLEELADTVNVVMILGRRHGLSFDDILKVGYEKFKETNDLRNT